MSQSVNWNPGDKPTGTFRNYLTTQHDQCGETKVDRAWYNDDSEAKWYVGYKLIPADSAGVVIVAWAEMPQPFVG